MLPDSNPLERAIQTAHTIDSIKSRIPNVEIWLCDSSCEPLSDIVLGIVRNESVKIMSFYNNSKIHEIKEFASKYNGGGKDGYEIDVEKGSLGILKNLTESYVILELLKSDISNFDRVFKISGRYALSGKFDISKWNQPGKAVLRKSESNYLPIELVETDGNHWCMLWSFCTSIKNEIVKVFEIINSDIVLYSQTNRITDIEHGLYKNLNKEYIYELENIGIMGRVNNVNSIIHT
jgi:hypothetical protein